MSAINKIGKNSSIALLGFAINGFSMFIISVLISRFLGAKGLGDYTLIFTIGSIGGVIGCIGFNVGIFQYIAFYREKSEYYKIIYLTKFIFTVVLVFSVVVGLSLFFLADTLAAYFEKLELVVLIKKICFFIPLWALMVTCFDAIRGYQDFYKQNLIEKIVRPSLMIGLYFIVLFFGGNVHDLLWALVFSSAIILVWSLIEIYLKIKSSTIKTIKHEQKRQDVVEWIKFSSPVAVESLLKFFIVQAGIEMFMLGKYVSSHELGVYSAVYRLLPFMMLPALSFSSGFGPFIAESFAKGEIFSLKQTYTTITRWIVSITMPLFACLVLFGDRILQVVFGDDFFSGYIALIILSCGFLFDAAVGEVRAIIMLSGRTFLYLINTMVMLIFCLLLCKLLIPAWGILGAAIAAASSRFFLNLIGLLQCYYFFKIHPFSVQNLKPFIAGVVSITVGILLRLYIKNNTIDESIIVILISLVIVFSPYFLTLFLLGIPKEEHHAFKQIKQKLLVAY